MDAHLVEQLLEQLIADQQNKLLSCARRIVPGITSDDILQPNDFPELENHPVFRYEEGILAGMKSVQIAFRAARKEFRIQKSEYRRNAETQRNAEV